MRPTKSIKEKIRHSLHLERALRLVWQSAPGWTVANFALILIQGLLPLVFLYLMKLIVDAVTMGIAAPDKHAAVIKLVWLILLAAAVALLGALLRRSCDGRSASSFRIMRTTTSRPGKISGWGISSWGRTMQGSLRLPGKPRRINSSGNCPGTMRPSWGTGLRTGGN